MKIAIIQYSTYGHVTKLSQHIKAGVEKAGKASQVDIFQVPETLSEDVLKMIHAPPKPTDIPIATTQTLEEYDAFLFGVPTRFGTLPSQFVDFWGKTSGLWASGALYGKPAGVFVSTGSPQGGQETTVRFFLSYIAHHGLIYIPLGYGPAFPLLTSFEEIHGGSPYGAGAYAGADGSRQPNKTELALMEVQGEEFAKAAYRFVGPVAPAVAAPVPAPVDEKAAPSEKAPVKAAKPAQRAAQSSTSAKKEEQATCSKCVIV